MKVLIASLKKGGQSALIAVFARIIMDNVHSFFQLPPLMISMCPCLTKMHVIPNAPEPVTVALAKE
jgi:hypothetical protein